MDLKTYELALAVQADVTELDRIAAECGAELRQTDGTPADLARACLECADQPRGEDAALCRRLAGSD